MVYCDYMRYVLRDFLGLGTRDLKAMPKVIKIFGLSERK
jgi:hypothetical protein